MTTRCGYVAIIGAPNAGKSTLMNRLVGSKLAAVTPKVQTTRNRITGIAMEDNSQIIFLDTPGVFAATKKFELAMVESAWGGLADANQVVLLVDAKRGLCDNLRIIIEKLKAAGKPVILVLNKIDLVEKEMLLGLSKGLYLEYDFERTFMICAKRGDGILDLKRYLAERMPEGPYLFPEDELSDITERVLASEITREKLFLRLSAELPYALAVETESWEEKSDGSVKINQVIMVQRENQKMIVVGAKGAALKAIGQSARKDLEEILGRKVHLFLFVKVDENWKDKPESYEYLGLEYKG